VAAAAAAVFVLAALMNAWALELDDTCNPVAAEFLMQAHTVKQLDPIEAATGLPSATHREEADEMLKPKEVHGGMPNTCLRTSSMSEACCSL